MINLFRTVSLLEGLSFLLILSVTLGFISREFVFSLGMTHGVLFLGYVALSLVASHIQRWSLVLWVCIFFAAIIPFGFIFVELLFQKQAKQLPEV